MAQLLQKQSRLRTDDFRCTKKCLGTRLPYKVIFLSSTKAATAPALLVALAMYIRECKNVSAGGIPNKELAIFPSHDSDTIGAFPICSVNAWCFQSINCERSELPSLFNARIFYIFIYIFQAVRRAVNEMFETPDTVFNNLELLVNPSSTAKKCSATEDCCRNPGGDRRPSSTVKYCSATGLLPNRQRGERPGVNGLPFSHRRKETPVFNKLQLLVNRRLRQNRRKRNKPVFNS